MERPPVPNRSSSMPYDETWQYSLPRSQTLEGDDLSITAVHSDGSVTITDGERAAVYRADVPLKGRELYIVPAYVEAGAFCEANVVLLTDGKSRAHYHPSR